MKPTFLLFTFSIFISVSTAFAQSVISPDSSITARVFTDNPATLLGLTPLELVERFGAPPRVFAVRGAEAWQDDVVFDYGEGVSLFLFMDRVWQVRVAKPYRNPVLGVALGSTTGLAASVLGVPVQSLAGAIEWVVLGQAWPVRLRCLIDEAGNIQELYVYRADF